MASIRTAIELYDAFSAPMMNVINAVNLGVSAMDDMRSAMSESFDAASLEGAREKIHQASIAMQELFSAAQQIEGPIEENIEQQEQFNREIERGTENANRLMDTIGHAVAAYATMQTVAKVIDLSDQLASTTARLDMMNDGLQSTQDLQNWIFLSAERSRASYQDTADAVSKLGLMAGNAFSSNEETIAFMEQVNKQFVIAGTEASGIQAAMLQLTQAMGAGVLRGEEYNSILEQAPNIIQTISGYIEGNEQALNSVAQAMGMNAEELALDVQGHMKDIAGEGILSAELVKSAILSAADETNAKFEAMPKTFGQIWTSFQNNALMAFQPVLERINEIGNSEAFQELVNGGIEALSVAAGISWEIFDILAGTAGFAADNWSLLSPVIYGVGGALLAYCGAMLLYNTVTTISTGITAAKALAEGIYAASLAMQTGATFTATAAQYGFNTALLACPLTWIILLVIAMIAIFYAAIAAMNKFSGTSVSATGIVASGFAVLGAFVMNRFVIPVQNALAMLVNFVGNAGDNMTAAIEVAFYDMCLIVIGYIQNLASAIETLLNKIPGVTVDITSGLDNFYSQLEKAQQTVKDESGWVEYMEKWDYINYGDAARAGYSFGEGIEDTIKNFDLSSLFENNIPSPDDYVGNGGGAPWDGVWDGIGNGIEDIARNTGRMADTMDITGEELKYLRDMAEQEVINRFTTAEIHIEQTNHNTIKNGMDLDGIMSSMTDMVNEAVDVSTEGVHV